MHALPALSPSFSRVLAMAVIATVGLPALALAQQPAGTAASSTATAQAPPAPVKFGDWELVCASPPSATACRLVQNHADQSGKTLLLVTILEAAAAKGAVAIVSVPKDVYLAPGIEMRIDDGQAFKLLYETCNDSGCHAGYTINGEIAVALKKGKIASHKVFNSRQQSTVVPVSLAGLTKGLERLAEVAK